MKRHLLAASALALAACTSAPPAIDTSVKKAEVGVTSGSREPHLIVGRPEPLPPVSLPTLETVPAPTNVMAAVSGGKHVYETFCAACHSGGDETAPELKTLHTFNRERVSTALSDKGLMALQSQMINADQREQVISFLTASPTTLAALEAANSSADPGGLKRDAYRPEYSYPVRRVRDERDSPDSERPPAWNAPPLGEGPFRSESWEQRDLKTSIVTRGLTSPRAIEFLPDGAVLITERAGTLRIVRDGKLDPKPIAGGPDKVAVLGTATGFMDIALHPDFKTNGLIYLSYHKPRGDLGSNAIWRGRWDGTKIVDGKDIFLSDDVDALYSRMAFGADGKLYFTIGCPGVGTDDSIGRAQDPGDFAGKTLRLNDDGTVPKDNPFAGRKDYNPELYTIGHRVNLGLTLNPWTKEFWVSEHGPNGGDEVNILRPAQNYGWPVVSDGRYYAGPKVSGEMPVHEGMTRPHISYVPSIAPGGMVFYTGDKFPAWKRNLFLGAMRMSNSPRTGHIERIVFNDNWEVIRSEMLLLDLHQRIRDVDQSPDGYLYAITDEGADSVLLKIEPGK